MRPLRALGNGIRRTARAIRLVLFWFTRIFGSALMVIPIGLYIYQVEITDGAAHPDRWPDALKTPLAALFGFFIFCKMAYPKLQPAAPLRLAKQPMRAPPLPVVTTGNGDPDDPNEAIIVGRLNPRLRALLQPPAPRRPWRPEQPNAAAAERGEA